MLRHDLCRRNLQSLKTLSTRAKRENSRHRLSAAPVDSIGGNLQSVPTIQTLLKSVVSPAPGEPDTSITGRQAIAISTCLSRSLTSLPEIIFRAESVATEHLKREIGNCKFDGRTNRD